MTVTSMTGFGAGRAEVELADGAQLTVDAEVRTVNHKHLQAKFRMPAEFAALENGLERMVREALQRGAVQISVDVTRTGGAASYEVDSALAARYLDAQRALRGDLTGFELREIQSMAELLALPGVIVAQRGGANVADDAPEANAVRDALGAALEAVRAMRDVEGESMRRDLANAADEIEALVAKIGTAMPEVQAAHRAKLVERVRELSEGVDVAEADLAREVAVLADRLDVSEELTRLASHLEQLRHHLERGGAIGRKLDFLAQEFFREANTIGSKCSDASVAHLVVDLKTWVERMREQVQNVV